MIRSLGDPDSKSNIQSIERKAAWGIFWRYAEEISTKAVSFFVTILLARLLTPADYAPVSIAVIIISFTDTIIDAGLSTALIQKGSPDEEDYSTVFTFMAAVSLLAYGIIFLGAPLVGRVYDNESLTGIIRVLCLLVVINSIKSVFFAGLRVKLQFKRIFFSSFIGTVISAAAGIFAAVRGMGAWALVIQQLTDGVIDALIMGVTSRIRIRPGFDSGRFKVLFKYSRHVLGASLTAQIVNAVVPVLLSLRYSVLELTYYTKAKGLSGLMLSFIETPLSQVLFPALSQIKDDRDRLLAVLRKFYKWLYFFTLPALFGLFVMAEDLVVLLLTDKWLDLVPYMRIFAMGMIFNKNIQGIKAIGRSDLYMKAVIACRLLGLAAVGVALLASDSPLAIAAAYVVLLASFYFIQVYLECKYLGYSVGNQLRDMLPYAGCAAIMAAAIYGVGLIPAVAGLGILLRVIVKAAAGVAVYLGLCALISRVR